MPNLKRKRPTATKIVVRLDDELAQRLELAGRVLGATKSRGGKKSDIIRDLLDTHLPDRHTLEKWVAYRRKNAWQREKVKEPPKPDCTFGPRTGESDK